ncbi:PaaI family thioesterase [Piscibacillus halophilus]|uniref:Thioesterase superfamily protein n=1 Tax=Piscibacillus halophilus TaxID=571933 RepID=A0A1H9JNI1_9BACI|nr:PaaI family thioesterase [Piscibacillus halophilus]SEQ88185.1 Thioesterase superfamily protein [Piscibacillus halophilus]
MTTIEHAIQDNYPNDFAHCYGCGRLNEDGHHFRTGWEGNQTVTYYTPDKKYTAVPGFVYGGFLASLIDCHGTGSASLALHRKNGYEPGDEEEAPRFVTASLEIKFTKPTPQGVTLKAIGNVEEVRENKFRTEIEVFAEEEKVASGTVVAVVMPDHFAK